MSFEMTLATMYYLAGAVAVFAGLAVPGGRWFKGWPVQARVVAAFATGLLWPVVMLCLALRFVAVGMWQIVGMARARIRTRDDAVPAAKVVRSPWIR